MYKTISEALEIYKHISPVKRFAIYDDVLNCGKTGNKFELVTWMDSNNIMHRGETSPAPVDSEDVEAWAICEKSADSFYNSDIWRS